MVMSLFHTLQTCIPADMLEGSTALNSPLILKQLFDVVIQKVFSNFFLLHLILNDTVEHQAVPVFGLHLAASLLSWF